MAADEKDGIAAEVLHEIKQPLLGLKAYLQLVRDDPGRPIPVPLLLAQVERIEQIVGDFHRLTNDRPAPLSPLKLSAPVRQAVAHFTSIPANEGIKVEVQVVFEVEFPGNSRLLEQLTLNLLNNARDAMEGKGQIKVMVTRESLKPTLFVADWGPGIPAEMREKIFEPYVTSKATGTGLGLVVCKRIAAEHQAKLDLAPPEAVSETPLPTTVFRVTFGYRNTPSENSARRPRVLVVDDEAVIRLMFKDLLSRDYDFSDAENAEQAMDRLRAGGIDLLIADKNLPGSSGLELAAQARSRWPNVRVILMTGYPSVVTAQQSVELGLVDYLVKPFEDIKLVRDLIREALIVPTGPTRARRGQGKRIDIYEDNPANAQQIVEAVQHLGYEPQVLTTATPGGSAPPVAIVMSWDFLPAQGKGGIAFLKHFAAGIPFLVLAEHLTMESALESLRGGATACLPKLLSDTGALSRELQRALKLPEL
jgi:CheY-like chemotaxis protein